jgi:hypothetical protein
MELTKEFEIACRIHDYTERGEMVWFTKLVDDLDGKMSRVTVSKYIDILFDLGMINGEWKQTEDGKMVRAFTIAGEAKKLVKNISEKNRNGAE